MKTILATCYVVSWVMEVSGLLIVASEIRADRRKAIEIIEEPNEVPTEVQLGSIAIGGFLGEQAARAQHSDDRIRRFLAAALGGDIRLRQIGVWLFIGGATVGLAANLIATF